MLEGTRYAKMPNEMSLGRLKNRGSRLESALDAFRTGQAVVLCETTGGHAFSHVTGRIRVSGGYTGLHAETADLPKSCFVDIYHCFGIIPPPPPPPNH